MLRSGGGWVAVTPRIAQGVDGRMRVGIGSIVQISNGFSATRTTIDDYRRSRLLAGDELHDEGQLRGPVGAVLSRAFSQCGWEVASLIEASSLAGGPLDEPAFQSLLERLNESLTDAGTLDLIVLHLSGSMLIDDGRSAERAMIDHLRASLSIHTPIWLMLDLRANLDPELLARAELVLAVPKPVDTELPAPIGRCLERLPAGVHDAGLHTSQRGPLFLVPLPNQRVDYPAVQQIEEVRRQVMELPDIVAANVSLGFPYADTPYTGASIWVTATSQDVAEDAAGKLQSELERVRDELTEADNLLNIEEAVHTAMANPGHSFILLDTGDDPAGGAPGDGTGLLWGLLDLGAHDAVLAPMVDQAAIEQAFAAGVETSIELDVGAKLDRRHGYPVEVRGKVVRLIERLADYDTGRVAIVQASGRHGGSVVMALTERRVVIDDLRFFDLLGINLHAHPIIAVKASAAPRVEPEALGRDLQVMLVSTPGITVPDFGYFPFKQLRAGVLPAPVS